MKTNYQKAMEEYKALPLPLDMDQVAAIADKYDLTDGQLFGIMFSIGEEAFA